MTDQGRASATARGGWWRRVLGPLLPPLAAAAIQWAAWDYLHPYAWLLFSLAIVLSSWAGALRGGVAATLLSLGLVWWLFIPAERALGQDPSVIVPSVAFVVTGVLIAALHGRARRSTDAALRVADERARLERSLRLKTEDLDRAQAVAAIGSWRLDLARDELRWSDETYRIFEIAPGTPMSTEAFFACVHPDDRAFVQRSWDAALGGAPYDLEHRIVVPSGTKVVREKADLERDEQGRLVGGVGIVQDLTARKRLEDEVRLAHATAAGIVSLSEDAIISIDDQQRITMFNEGAERMFGYGRAEVLGAPLDVLIPAPLRAVHRRQIERFAASPEVAGPAHERLAAVTGLRKGGDEFPADASIAKLDVGGQRLLIVTVRDVTEQRRAEREQRFLAEVGLVLASSLEYDETLAKIADLAVRDLADYCIVDVMTERGELRRLRVVSRDPANAWICEWAMRFPLDRSRSTLFAPVLQRKEAVLRAHLSEDEAASYAQDEEHLRLIRAAGPTSIMVVPMVVHGALLGAIGFVSSTASRSYDSSDLRFAEELARRAALAIENARLYRVAQRAIEARDDLMGIVAHDLRNPLNTIGLHATSLLERGGEPERKSARVIERATARMNRLIQDLLDVARLEAGQLTVDHAAVTAAEVVADAVELQRPAATAAGLELAVDVAGDLPALWADHDRLVQIFENLIGNAIKFTERGGRIEVRAEPHGGEVWFTVTDTGIGLTPDEQARLFDRFWQAPARRQGGAGLGLPIVKGLVEAHGGHVWVESTPGHGSCFAFSIPAAPRPGDNTSASGLDLACP